MKISLADAADELETLCNEVDNAEEIDKRLLNSFNDAKLTLEDSVDRRLRYIMYAESSAAKSRDMASMWSQRARNLERAVKWIKENTLHVMKANPSLPYKGSLGGFRVARNSIPVLKHDAPTISKSYDVVEMKNGNTLHSYDLEGCSLPREYFKKQIIFVVDKDKLKYELGAGIEVPGASYEIGEHVRITLEKK